MVLSQGTLTKIGAICFFVNGIIFIFYGLSVPALVHGVHWLITLAAILFLAALPAIYNSMLRRNSAVARLVVALLAVAMAVLTVSDVLFAAAVLSAFNHDLAYALGNAAFLVCIVVIGVMALKGAFFRWFGYLSIVAAIIGLSTYVPQAPGLVATISLLLLGLWSLAFAFNVAKMNKHATAPKQRRSSGRRANTRGSGPRRRICEPVHKLGLKIVTPANPRNILGINF
jgi:hypothetical protein